MHLVKTSVVTSDGSITTTPGLVFGVLVSAAATGGAWQLNDSSDDSGTDLISGVAQANSQHFINLSEIPVQFNTGIRADLGGSNQTITVFYTSS
jgi:hypothetical protein